MISFARLTLASVCAAFALVACSGQNSAPKELTPPPAAVAEAPELDVPYVPTPEAVVKQMLALGRLQPGQYLIDLGCGDGRIVNMGLAATPGATGMGVDIDPERIAEAKAGAAAAGVADRADFRIQDLFDTDFSKADVLTMYLLPDVNLRLREKIITTMRPGARAVSHDFNMGEWSPDQTVEVEGDGSTVYLWVIPANIAGTWKVDGAGEMTITQTFQNFAGSGRDARGPYTIADGKMNGAEATFKIVRASGAAQTIKAKVEGDALLGQGLKAARTAAGKIGLAGDTPLAPAPAAPAP